MAAGHTPQHDLPPNLVQYRISRTDWRLASTNEATLTALTMSDAIAFPVRAVNDVTNSGTTAVETLESIQKRYTVERQKRLREDGLKQYIDLSHAAERFKHFGDDIFVSRRMFVAKTIRLTMLGGP